MERIRKWVDREMRHLQNRNDPSSRSRHYYIYPKWKRLDKYMFISKKENRLSIDRLVNDMVIDKASWRIVYDGPERIVFVVNMDEYPFFTELYFRNAFQLILSIRHSYKINSPLECSNGFMVIDIGIGDDGSGHHFWRTKVSKELYNVVLDMDSVKHDNDNVVNSEHDVLIIGR